MFEQLEFDNNGVKTICERNGKNAEMMMTIKVKKFKAMEEITVIDGECETAFLILKGDAQITWCGRTEHIFRESSFVKKPFCLHVPRNTPPAPHGSSDGIRDSRWN